MSRSLYILDLDRTLFDTHRFFRDIMHTLQRTHSLDMAQFDATYRAFIEPASGGYDPHAHHEHLLGITAHELDELITQELGDTSYLFPDADEWLKRHIKNPDIDLVVVTMGRPRYQELKFHHAPTIKPLRKVVVRTNKGEVFRHHLENGASQYGLDFLDYPYEQITLIDDAVGTFTALGNTPRITGIRIARPGEKYSDLPTPPHVREITNFGELA
jgi:FMN phosphatase YigB (HAD superfamily)